MYHNNNKAKSLFNSYALEYFHSLLAEKGIDEVYYYNKKTSFYKEYGYFIVD